MTPDLRDVMVIAHPAGTTLVDITERNQRGVERAAREALAVLRREVGADCKTSATVSECRIPAAALDAMRDGSKLWVVR